MDVGCVLPCFRRRTASANRRLANAREQEKTNQRIEQELKLAKEQGQKSHKVLLLGCGQAGKSTFIKQMRIINASTFDTDEKSKFKSDIASNISSSIKVLLENVPSEMKAELEANHDIQNAVDALKYSLWTSDRQKRLCPDEVYRVANEISFLWRSRAVQSAYKKRNTFQLIDTAEYFLSRVHEVMDPEYVVSNDDIVRARVRTEGIIKYSYQTPGATGKDIQTIVFIDVGGQRSQRKKWLHCFDDVLILIFLAAVSEFDQVLEEDHNTNRLSESISLLRVLLSTKFFKHTPTILFLNKIDILRNKLAAGADISSTFPDFCLCSGIQRLDENSSSLLNGGTLDEAEVEERYGQAIDFFERKFREPHPGRDIFVHRTCATDTENIRVVEYHVRGTILKLILKNIGLQ